MKNKYFPHKEPTSQCNRCGKPIYFKKLPKGYRPFNPDNTLHFQTCHPDAVFMMNRFKEISRKNQGLNKFKEEPLQIGQNDFI